MTPYHFALHRCAERYRDMQLKEGSSDPLWKLTMDFMFGCRDGLPVPKLCRWLGYIQGLLIERCYTTVEAERDWTRPLFRPLDFPDADIDRRAVSRSIVSDEEIERVHANANFGSMDKREVVDRALLQVACGFTTGHTAGQILAEHGLIRQNTRKLPATITAKGREYLWAVYGTETL